MNFIPRIHHFSLLDNSCRIPDSIAVSSGEFPLSCLNPFLMRTTCKTTEGDFLRLIKDNTIKEEAYTLTITPEHITVAASSEKGVIWALTTLSQMIVDGKVPCGTIVDEPKYPYRGLSLDCARHFYSVEETKKIIEAISLVKMNTLHWHLTDDQGWRIESKIMPRLHEVSKVFYTQEEIKDIVHYARVRGVEIIPEIDMPGHVSALLAAYPEYSCSGKTIDLVETSGIFPYILCAGQDKTYQLIESLFEEIVPLFESQYFHIGGDEVPKEEWMNCRHCQNKLLELGYSDYHDLQAFFTENVIDILKKYGKKAVVWNESLLGNHPPKDILVQYWTPVHRKAMKPFLDQGGQWIYSDMFELYLDYPHSMTSLTKVFKTKPHIGVKNMSNHPGLLGMECCLWSERIHNDERLENLLFPRVIAFAEIAWSGQSSYDNFEKRLHSLATSPCMRTLRFTNKSLWNMSGKARKEEALAYFKLMFDSMSEEAKKTTNDYAKPSGEFAFTFVRKFFRLRDIPSLLKILKKHK